MIMRDLINAAYNKIRNILARGRVQLTNDSKGVQLAQVTLMADEVSDDMDHPQEYGFTSLAPGDSECLAAFFAGEREHGTILTIFNRSVRPKAILAVGDVMLYDNRGNQILIKNGELFIKHATKVTIDAPSIEIKGNAHITGHLDVDGYIKSKSDITDNSATNTRSMAGMRSQYNTHTHQEHDGPSTGNPSNSM